MGNCSVKGIIHGGPNFIRVLTESGNILEFKTPVFVGEVLQSHPGYGVFQKCHVKSPPLSDDELLVNGQFYYLLPLGKDHKRGCRADMAKKKHVDDMRENKPEKEQQIEPPKMSSADFVEKLSENSSSALQVLPSQGNGVWRVKLVINTKQLEEILSEQVNTEALIEKMRMAAVNSGGLTPRRSKSSWVVGWKPVFSNVFKVPLDNGR